MRNWKHTTLGEIAKIYDGTHQTPAYVSEGIPFYSVEHVTSNSFTDTKYVSREVFEKENKRVKIEKGDILMTRIGDVGTAKYLDWDVQASFYVSLSLIKCNPNVNPKFITQLINSSVLRREIWGKTLHVAFPNKINLGDISKCRIHLPSLIEQNEIAKLLEVWDAYLERLNKKIDLKTVARNSLRRNLLYAEKRLSGFDQEWTEVRLGELYKITSSKRVFESDWVAQGVPFYRAREVIKLRDHGDVDNKLFITVEMFKKFKERYGSVKKNDILVTGVGTVGIAYRVVDFIDFYFKDGNIIWLQDLGKVSSAYVEHVFRSDIIKQQIHKFTPITTVATYTIEMANSTKIPLPPRDEQEAISKIITTANEEISALRKLRDSVMKQKNYLASGLLAGKILIPGGTDA